MRTNTISGLFSLYLSIILLVILVSISDKAYAKRGCAAFGHTCYGGYGKRFDSTVERNSLQNSITRNIQESKVPLSNVELFYILPNDEFRERSDQSFMRTHRDTQQVNVHPLSFLVDHWIALHRRRHHTNMDITNK
ncbi:PREDICTED: uncharacterized protein LOC105144073 isoform X2 [Acromyrmex echinatior]|uniref:uncharacterized protein LOC105144073 isoform X2 n=1 Tax=Acromyrmex echinatior TaxID=103372 RepID=UPI000580B558|nr:PREDICTED: uncharacterized protein LOC105144073 isoform X2 [Acromyrmex echinatior]